MKKRYMIPALLACSGFCMAGYGIRSHYRRRSGCGRG